ncbi:hypothetical protein EI427_19550 [Flammeovirga pectinis]|uniref:Transporter suffix domain-containing protein n=1 Tax=Flammeovirga pectinis TaxID=2494373 RepID=A0A3Q9FP62_9BACT|nr:hypothetical protein [Flammeovirga pectinis]AZQ64327.1 hypothetical protein EI427_19550 [Flammeovirga pectinis]
MKNKKASIKSKIGLALISCAVLMPVLGLLIPFLGLNKIVTGALVGLFLVGGPEIFIVLGVTLAGKEGITIVKNFIKKVFGLPQGNYPATNKQYRLGLIILIISIGVQFIISYLSVVITIKYLLYFTIGADVLFIVGVFICGEQFVTKLKKLCQWESWQLQSKVGNTKMKQV